MVYVLIVVVLLAALTLILARQGDTSEQGNLSAERTEIAANQILATTMQLKQAVDQMLYSGATPATLDFTTPDDEPAYSTAPHVNKVFHPEGGGVVMPRIIDDAINQVSADPPAQWYIGRFNNTDWTASAAEDVILAAHQIKEEVCAAINLKLTGAATIPAAAAEPRNFAIDDQLHGGTNADLNAAACAGCAGALQLCVEAPSGDSWTFYSVVVPQ